MPHRAAGFALRPCGRRRRRRKKGRHPGSLRPDQDADRKDPSDYDREKLQEGLAKLAGGVAVIRVGGATEIKVTKKGRVDDAVHEMRRQASGRRQPDRGYDAQEGQYVDTVNAGIVNPTEAMRLALQSGASVAGS